MLPRMKRLLLPLLAVLWPALAGATDLVVWSHYRGAELKALEKVVKQYNAAHAASGVTVKVVSLPAESYLDELTKAVPSGKGPDVFVFPQELVGAWVERGAMLAPLEEHLPHMVWKVVYTPTTIDMVRYRNHYFGLPLNIKVLALIYNKKLVSSIPSNTNQLRKLCRERAATKGGAVCLAWEYTDFYSFAPLMHAFEGPLSVPGHKLTLDSPQTHRAMETLLEWRKEPGFLPDNPSAELVTSLFNEGKTPFVIAGPGFLDGVAKRIDYGVAELPNVSEASDALKKEPSPMRPYLTVEAVGVSATSKHKKAAAEFARYLTGHEGATVMALEGGQIPASPTVTKGDRASAVSMDLVQAAFRRQSQVSIPTPLFREMTLVWSPGTAAIRAVISGAATPKAAFKEAQKKLEEDIARLPPRRRATTVAELLGEGP
jgi:arabinogalactan oligomer/maltooligosaccharide transport system substrate-binding protein